MSRSKEDWSDSDDEDGLEEGYTSVHLGIPSDVIDLEDDLHDPYVSRIGGTPVRPSSAIVQSAKISRMLVYSA